MLTRVLSGLILLVGLSAATTRADALASAEFDRALQEFDEAQRLRTEQPDRARQLYRSAAARFENLISAGIDNGYLEYNLGNCYLQACDIGRAVLHYLRARRFIPRDPLLTDNLGVARSRCLLGIPPGRSDAVLRSVFFWHYETSLSGRANTALASYILFWMLVAIWVWMRRKGVLIAAGVCGAVAACSGGSYAAQIWIDRNAPPAVVVAPDVAVYKGPAATWQRQFEQPLQPGVEVTLRQRRGDWCQIELPDGHRGWVESSAIEVVPLARETASFAFLPM